GGRKGERGWTWGGKVLATRRVGDPRACARGQLRKLCTTRCVALGVGARGAYTRGHSETRYGDVCLREPAPRLRVRLRGALACKAPSAPTPSATITCADVPFELMQERALLCARPFVS